jgi:outer membrane receptor protein involved in Fe transport
MSKRTDFGFRSTLLGGISLAALLAAPAWGQATDTLETVTVTGSRVITDTTLSPTPITTLSTEQLQVTTPSDIPDALNKLPNILGGRTPRTQGNGSTNNGGNTIALRNFGASRTLVLLDGHRVPASNQDGTVNIDTLPQVLMEKIDIVTGGASAVYGSDAVAGVINFVLDKKFTGFKFNLNAGISNYGDGAEHQAELAWGTDLFGGKGHFETSARYRYQDMVLIKDRPYGANGQAWLQAGNGKPINPAIPNDAPWVDVPYGRTFNQSMTGTINCGSACAYNKYTFRSPGVIGPMVHGITTPSSGIETGGDGGWVQDGTFRSKVRMADWFGRFSYDLTKDINVYVQGSAAESEDFSRWITWVVSGSGTRPNAIFANNPFLTAQTQQMLGANINCSDPVASAGWRCLPATPPTGSNGTTPPPPPNVPYFSAPSYIWSHVNGVDAPQNLYQTRGLQRNLNLEAGATGTLAGLAWDVYYSHGESRLKVLNPDNTDNQKYWASLDAVIAPPGTKVNNQDIGGTVTCWVLTQPQYAGLYPGCIPTNITDPGGPSQAAYDYLRTPTWWVLTQKVDDVGGSIHGGLWGLGLPAGEITAALSAEARWNTYDMNNNSHGPMDFVDCTGLRLCLANSGGTPPPVAVRWVQNTNAPVSASNSVYEFALEVNVPLLKNLPMAQDLSTDLAGRYTDYSTFGSVETWKVGLDWHLDEQVHFRGTMSYDIRAPFLNDLYQPSGISSTGFQDLLTGASGNTRLVTRGNPKLVPEQARTYTAGMVLTPNFLSDFSLSVDWYNTHMTKAISNISFQSNDVQNICNTSPNYSSPFCQLVVRPISNPSDPNYKSAANYPLEVWSAPVNAAIQQMEGFDIEANYRWELEKWVDGWKGNFTLRHMMTYQPVNKTINFPGSPVTWAFAPKLRQSTFLVYNNGNFTLALQNQLLGSTKKITSPGQVWVKPSIGSNDVLDVTVSERFDLWGFNNEVYLSVSNIADTRAPLYTNGTAGLPGLFYPTAGFHDDMGRYYTLGIKGTF